VATVNQEFQSAAMCRRMAFFAIAQGAIVIVVAMVAPFAASLKVSSLQRSMWPSAFQFLPAIVAIAGVAVAIPIFLRERAKVAVIKIEDNCLKLDKAYFPLKGLVEVSRNPEVMKWAFRRCGNGGLGAVRGRYWSTRVGKFEAFLTDSEYAVVLRWPDRKIVVSPADPEFFITCARSAAGIR
jgi:hypothetical protein